jgi:hypothetical protein
MNGYQFHNFWVTQRVATEVDNTSYSMIILISLYRATKEIAFLGY